MRQPLQQQSPEKQHDHHFQQVQPQQLRRQHPIVANYNILRYLVVLLSLVKSVQGKRMAFHYDGLETAACKSGTFDIQLHSLQFVCQNGDLCRPGDTVKLHGSFLSDKVLPVDITMRTKACKYYGTVCSPEFLLKETSFKTEFGIKSLYQNNTYPSPGWYTFQKTFVMPNNALTDYAFAGLQFNMVADLQADDAGGNYVPHLRCHAGFTTVDYDAYLEDGSTGSGFSTGFGGKWSILGVLGLLGGGYAGFMERKRRLAIATPAIDLNYYDADAVVVDNVVVVAVQHHHNHHDHDHNDHNNYTTSFEIMMAPDQDDHYNQYDDDGQDDDDSVRV